MKQEPGRRQPGIPSLQGGEDVKGLYMMFAWDTKGIGAARRILATFIFSTQVLTLLYLIVYHVIA